MAKKELGYDADGSKRVMRTSDYLTDMGGQLALGIMGNIVGQLTYFYTDKVGLAIESVGIVMAIAKVLDAFTDVIFGNFIDHSKGGNKKYYQWMIRMAVPAAAIMIVMFTVPIQAGTIPALLYVLVTNILLTAVIYTMISTPFASIMVVRTNSQQERSTMGVFRAVGSYGAGMLIAITTIPLTNALGGTQSAWIKYGVILGLLVLLLFLICYYNGRKAKFASDFAAQDASTPVQQEEKENVPFKNAVVMLLKNRYWVIVLLFNVITQITNTMASSAGTYYCKWIFGDDNLVAVIGSFGMLATIVGFVLSKPIIAKLGVKRTVNFGLLGAAIPAAIRCFAPTNFILYAATSLIGSFVQIPLMCLYGVLLAMSIDYNEWKYDNQMVATSSGAIGFGFGNKVGGGVGTLLLSGILSVGAYDATLEVASTSMRYAIYALNNYVPLIINLVMFVIFLQFDLEKKLPAMRAEVAERRAKAQEKK